MFDTSLANRRHLKALAVAALLPLAGLLPTAIPAAFAESSAILEGERFHPQEGQHGMVATSHYLASQVARDVLADGGNAVDAAVVAGFALAVTQPRSGNIGGGGFMLVSDEKTGEVVAIDYREKAPAAASETMFQDENGEAVSEWSLSLIHI